MTNTTTRTEHGTGSDGSTLTIHVAQHVNMPPTGTINEFFPATSHAASPATRPPSFAGAAAPTTRGEEVEKVLVQFTWASKR